MPKSKTGVLPKQDLRSLLVPGYIEGVTEKYLNPASIDLPLSDEAYRIEAIFLPKGNETVHDLLPSLGATKHNLENPLEVGVPYLIRIAGKWKLPTMVYGYANPKSSTGRIGFFCRTVADRVSMYDALPSPGWNGEIWMLARPDFMPVLAMPGLPLSQLRLFDGKSFLDSLYSELAVTKSGLLFTEDGRKLSLPETRRHDDSFVLTIHVGEMMGWECWGTRKVIDAATGGRPGA